MQNDLFDNMMCQYTISDKLHPYEQVDLLYNENYYKKYIIEKNGGTIYGNNLYKYDFDIKNNTPLLRSKPMHPFPAGVGEIFLGNKLECAKVEIHKNIAEIHFFGYHKSCSINNFLERNIGTKHMFLWLIICILKNFPNVSRIELGDDSKIECDRIPRLLAKYYFIKYGKQYYELFFNFTPLFYSSNYEKKFLQNIQKRKYLRITKNDFLKIFNNYKNKNLNIYNNFIKIFKYNSISIVKFYKKIPKNIQYKYCDFFFYMTDELFDKYFHNNLGQTYFIYINDKNEFITKIQKLIEKLIK